MCLVIAIETHPDHQEILISAAAIASAQGLRVDVRRPSRWSWAKRSPITAKITEDGGCSCSLLADDADWNSETWTLRADVVLQTVATFRAFLENAPIPLRISALWAGDESANLEQVDAVTFLELVAVRGLGTRTTYAVNDAAKLAGD